MRCYDLVVSAERVVLRGQVGPATLGIRRGVIEDVVKRSRAFRGREHIELRSDEVLLPGLVDSHVHINEPGRTQWEGFWTATRAAAAGGVTTVIDMPLNSIPPTVDLDSLEVKRLAAAGKAFVDVGFWGGAVPQSLGRLEPLHEAGVFGFKCFTLPSGVDEFPPLDNAQLVRAMSEIAAFNGLLIVHAEDHRHINGTVDSGRSYAAFLASRPRDAENKAVQAVIAAAAETGCRTHLLHLSSSEALPLLEKARSEGVALTAETCPHYLCISAEEVPDGATEFKCCPPIREAENQDALWRALREGTIEMVVSDHSPSTPDLKHLESGDFALAWGGISSLQLGLPLLWTHGRPRGFTLTDITRWMCEAPASLARLPTKGRIEVGNDADLCVFAPDEEFVVDPGRLHHRNAITPYAGQRLTGVVRRTYLAGAPIELTAAPRGRLLTRGTA